MTTPTPTTIDDLASLSLAELNDLAELLTRTDRKYIVSEELLGGLLSGCGDDIVVLEKKLLTQEKWDEVFSFENLIAPKFEQ